MVYYIKLGRGGCWEADSIASDLLRIGWASQSIEDINAGNWVKIENELRLVQPDLPHVATTDLNRLRDIATSTPDDIWITFHGAKLWWTRLAPGSVLQDHVSKFRQTQQKWRDTTYDGRLLAVNDLPGKLTMLQGFRGTVCKVKHADLLMRVLSGECSPLSIAIANKRVALAGLLSEAVQGLHWKDYETLVDLVFRHAGWERVSVLGQHAKAYDLELREPLTGARYVVQVKSQANLADLIASAEHFAPRDFRRVFFVVHTPANDLHQSQKIPSHVELVAPEHLASLALEAGLTSWLEAKVR